MISLLVPPGAIQAGVLVRLEEEEVRHLKVRREDVGSPVRLVDGVGMLGFGALAADGTVRCERVELVPRSTPVTLLVGAGDKDRFSDLVEKATELGATDIVPLETTRSLAVGPRVRESHVPRLVRRARETLKQCGSAWAPAIEAPVTLERWLLRRAGGVRWLADAEGEPAQEVGAGEALTIAVGPEGGFTPEERARLVGVGFRPLRLGPHILRFETAAIAALTVAWQAVTRGRHG